MTVLHDLIRSELDAAGPDPDYDVIADKVVASLPSDKVDSILRTLVRGRVSVVAAVHRRLTETGMDGRPAEIRPDWVDSYTARPKPGPSRRSQGVPAYQRWLNELVIVEVEGRPKRMGNCTADDFRFIASQRFKSASDVWAVGEWYETVSKTIDNAAVPTLGDLPPDQLEAVFNARKAAA